VQKKDEYSAIEPISEEVVFRGKSYVVAPLTVGQIPRFARALKPLAGVDLLGSLSAADAGTILALVADHGESLIEAVAVATGVPKAEIEAASADELIGIAMIVVGVNGDFFSRRLAPAISKALQLARSGAGRMPSTP